MPKRDTRRFAKQNGAYRNQLTARKMLGPDRAAAADIDKRAAVCARGARRRWPWQRQSGAEGRAQGGAHNGVGLSVTVSRGSMARSQMAVRGLCRPQCMGRGPEEA